MSSFHVQLQLLTQEALVIASATWARERAKEGGRQRKSEGESERARERAKEQGRQRKSEEESE